MIRYMLASFALGLFGCGNGSPASSSSPTSCVPGASESCTCSNGESGAQVCRADGAAFDACDCGADQSSGGASGGGDSGGGSGGTGGSGGGAGGGEAAPGALWSVAYGPGAVPEALAVNGANRVVVAGDISGEDGVDFGNGPIGGGNVDPAKTFFLAVAADTGSRDSAFGLTTRFWSRPKLGLAPDGDLIVAGAIQTSGNDRPRGVCAGAYGDWGRDSIALAKMSTSGDCRWGKAGDVETVSMMPIDVAVTSDGSVLFTGLNDEISGTTYDRSTFEKERPTRRFTYKFSSAGDEEWRRADGGHKIHTDGSDNIYLIDYDYGVAEHTKLSADGRNPVELPGGNRHAVAEDGSFVVATRPWQSPDEGLSLISYDPAGQVRFEHVIAEPKSDSGGYNESSFCPFVLPDGRVGLAGAFWRTTDFGTGPETAVGTGDDDYDLFVAVYEQDGTPIRTQVFGGSGPDLLASCKVNPDGVLFLTGTFHERIDFGHGAHDAPTDTNLTTMYLAAIHP